MHMGTSPAMEMVVRKVIEFVGCLCPQPLAHLSFYCFYGRAWARGISCALSQKSNKIQYCPPPTANLRLETHHRCRCCGATKLQNSLLRGGRPFEDGHWVLCPSPFIYYCNRTWNYQCRPRLERGSRTMTAGSVKHKQRGRDKKRSQNV